MCKLTLLISMRIEIECITLLDTFFPAKPYQFQNGDIQIQDMKFFVFLRNEARIPGKGVCLQTGIHRDQSVVARPRSRVYTKANSLRNSKSIILRYTDVPNRLNSNLHSLTANRLLLQQPSEQKPIIFNQSACANIRRRHETPSRRC